VSAAIFIEGSKRGEHSKEMDVRCRRAFHALLDPICPMRKPSLHPCGGRDRAFKDFCTAQKQGKASFVALLVDSEDPVEDLGKPWEHLKKRDGWDRPRGSKDDQVLFMTTCMETWIVADREALKTHFRQLHEKALPPFHDLERRAREDVLHTLEHATRRCRSPFKKGNRSFDVLAKLNPAALRQHLPSFQRLERILQSKL
jgi:hypothetical protein